MIIVDANYSSIDTLKIKSILQVTKIKTQSNNQSMLIYSIIFKNDYDNIDNNCFITCSDMEDSLINYSKYIPIYNVYSISSSENRKTAFPSSENQQFNNDIYVFQIKGNQIDLFTKYKLSYIFDAKLSTSSYNYLHNDIDAETYYKPLAVFMINYSTYDKTNNITTINTSKISLVETIIAGDNIFIKNNVVLKINEIYTTSKNTDVVTNYNSYINSSNVVGISNDNIITNLTAILGGTIKYNTNYISNLYNNIFNAVNYFFHIIEIGYDPTTNLFISYQKYQNTYLKTILDYLLNIIIDANIQNYFLYRESTDIYYNNLLYFNQFSGSQMRISTRI
jgi:hypothetical protein